MSATASTGGRVGPPGRQARSHSSWGLGARSPPPAERAPRAPTIRHHLSVVNRIGPGRSGVVPIRGAGWHRVAVAGRARGARGARVARGEWLLHSDPYAG